MKIYQFTEDLVNANDTIIKKKNTYMYEISIFIFYF